GHRGSAALHGEPSHAQRQSRGREAEGHGRPRGAADHERSRHAHDLRADAERPTGPQR
ncbi:hypothetical protein M9458_010266, partial [Cirrhinus mrigala]